MRPPNSAEGQGTPSSARRSSSFLTAAVLRDGLLKLDLSYASLWLSNRPTIACSYAILRGWASAVLATMDWRRPAVQSVEKFFSQSTNLHNASCLSPLRANLIGIVRRDSLCRVGKKPKMRLAETLNKDVSPHVALFRGRVFCFATALGFLFGQRHRRSANK